ncbi:MAG: hypothetical protein KAS72_04790 [Phycisphaerales bacterium]|nr:hypothetical protein [Phycisphaerales bacterium]
MLTTPLQMLLFVIAGWLNEAQREKTASVSARGSSEPTPGRASREVLA